MPLIINAAPAATHRQGFLKSSTFSTFISTLFLLLMIPLFSSCEKQRTIVNGVEEREANEIIVLLATKGVEAEKVAVISQGGGGGQLIPTFDIKVSEKEAVVAMSILNNAGLPRRKSANLLQIFNNTGLVPTDTEQNIRYQAGLAEQIASTIRDIDGIINADVIISYPKEDPLNPTAPKKDITASVFVKHSGVLDDPNSHLASKIKNLVASSVAGLKYDNVTLIPDRARFAEMTSQRAAKNAEIPQYVRLWTVTVAKDSVTQFRLLFFSFSLLILFLIVALIWILWKISPLLQDHGGIKGIFHLQPLDKVNKKSVKNEVSLEKEKRKPSEKRNQDEGLFDEESYADESADFGGEVDVSDEER